MLKAGICGFGGLGHVHANTLSGMEGVDLRAVCDIDPTQLELKEVQINITTDQRGIDLDRLNKYLVFEEMLDKEDLDLVVIATPTDIHADYSIMAMETGVNVFSEKPMALNVPDCDRMIEAKNRTGKQLMIGQCLRFWPSYEYLCECVQDKRFGNLRSLMMERIGSFHKEGSWFNDHRRSGGAIIDLHLHDVDWVQVVMGMPDEIVARGTVGLTGGIDDVTAIWRYGDSTMVSIRGSWMYTGFRMLYTALFDEASVDFNPGGLKVTRLDGSPVDGIQLKQGTGHEHEMKYFIECVRGDRENTRCTPESTRDSIALIYKEIDSIQTAR